MVTGDNDNAMEALAVTRRAINDIRVMMWAGDYENARIVIGNTISSFSKELSTAEKLRKDVVRLEREIRGSTEIDEKTLTMQKIMKMEAASMHSAKMIDGKAIYFSLGALANILLKLDKRIAEQIGEKPIASKGFAKVSFKKSKSISVSDNGIQQGINVFSGFTYVLLKIDENKVECRAYRLGETKIQLSEVEKRISHISFFKELKRVSAFDVQNQEILPYTYKGFLENKIYVELTIFDTNRIKIYIVTENEADAMEQLHAIIHLFE